MKLLNFFLPFISIYCLSQNVRDNKFIIKTGIEYRVTPYDFKSNSPREEQNIDYTRDKQLSGFSLNAGIYYLLFKNTSFGISQSIRYDEIYYNNNFNENGVTISSLKKDFILDTHLELQHYFLLKNNDKLSLLLGYSFMNNNTDYYETIPLYDNNGVITGYTSGVNNFSFKAIKLAFGYQYKNLEFQIGNYFIDNHHFYLYGTSAIGMPFLKLNYSLIKF